MGFDTPDTESEPYRGTLAKSRSSVPGIRTETRLAVQRGIHNLAYDGATSPQTFRRLSQGAIRPMSYLHRPTASQVGVFPNTRLLAQRIHFRKILPGGRRRPPRSAERRGGQE